MPDDKVGAIAKALTTDSAQLEYASLREELLRRNDTRQQIISIALTIAAAVLSFGWGGGAAVIIWIYPLIAVCLAAGWVQNETRVADLSRYIREEIEPNIPGLGWETYLMKRQPQRARSTFPVALLGGIFPVTQLMSIVLGLSKYTAAPIEIILLVAGVISLVGTLSLVQSMLTRVKA